MAWWNLPGLTTLFDIVCPPRCAFCGADLAGPAAAGGTMACESCAAAISSDSARCIACGEPRSAVDCRCRGRRGDWDGIVVLASYGDSVREPVLRAKRPAGEPVAAALAGLLVAKHRERFSEWRIDTVVPVPMHWLRRAVRGTSAAEELARRMATLLGVRSRTVLLRRRATRMQNELPVHERRGNVRDAFRTRHRVDGRRILIVDDVVTTGSTLAACRRTLVAAGAAAVFAAVVAKADRLPDGGDA